MLFIIKIEPEKVVVVFDVIITLKKDTESLPQCTKLRSLYWVTMLIFFMEVTSFYRNSLTLSSTTFLSTKHLTSFFSLFYGKLFYDKLVERHKKYVRQNEFW